jgi:glutaredoxin
MKRIIALLVLSVCIPASAQQIYRVVGADGRVQYTDKPPAGANAAAVKPRISSYSGEAVVTGSAPAGVKPAQARPEIRMYATDWCGYCRKARAYFARNGIRYTELDVEKSEVARLEYRSMGARGVPVILVGTQRMNGYSEERLAAMLKAAGY